jgi:hypothetical protein
MRTRLPSWRHTYIFCASLIRGFGISAMDIFATNTNASGEATATTLRTASLSIAAYEYVFSCVSPPLIVTHIRPAISLPSLWNIDCIGPPIETCKKIAASFRRYSLDLDTLHTRCTLLILFILIRYVFS